MRASFILLAVAWSALLSNVNADTAIPFNYDPVTTAQASRPVRVAMDGDVAAVIEVGYTRYASARTNNLRAYYRSSATNWVETDLPAPSSGIALSVDVDDCRMVVGLVGTANVWAISCGSSKPGWTLEQTLVFTNPTYRATAAVLDGDRLALKVVDNGGLFENGQSSVYIYDYTGASWVFRKEVGILSTGTLSLAVGFVAENIDLDGDRLAVSATFGRIIQIFEKDQGGANMWGGVKTIIDTPPDKEYHGMSLALDGGRLAATAIDEASSAPCVLVYSNNTGGAGNWGYAGELVAPQPERQTLMLDSDNGFLAVFGIPRFTGIFQNGAPAEGRIYRGGAGPGGWTHERTMELGEFRSSFYAFTSPGFIGSETYPNISYSGTRFMVGLPHTADFEDKGGWAASFRSRLQGGPGAWGHEFTIEPPGVPGEFGFSMKTDGNFLVAGMPYDNWAGADSGSAYVWHLAEVGGERVWLPVARLIKPNGAANDQFGYSVDIEETETFKARVLVGAPGELGAKGAAYLYYVELNAGQAMIERRLTPQPYTDPGAFGFAVALQDGRAAVGAPYSNLSSTQGGAVFIFEENAGGSENWGCVRTNLPPNLGVNFGTRLDLENSILAVGRSYVLYNGPAVFIYKRNQGGTGNWGLFDTILPPADPFGYAWSLDLGGSGGSLIVGELGVDGVTNGQAHIYFENAGVTGYDLFYTIDDPMGDGTTFGSGVSWGSGLSILVGAYGGGTHTGGVMRAFGFSTAGGTTSVVQIAAVEGDLPFDRLGWQVEGVSFIYAAAAAPRNDSNGNNAGQIKTMRTGSYEYWAADQPASFATAWLPWENWDGDPDMNLLEFAMGTDPMNPSDYSKLYMRPHYASSPVTMAWEKPDLPYSTLGLNYSMRRAANLDEWKFVAYDTISTNGMTLRLYETPDKWSQYRLEPRYPDFSSSGGGGIILLRE